MNGNRLSPHTVDEVMTRTVVAVGPDAPFKEIVQTLRQWNVSALPVLEGDGRVVGVVSEGDLLVKEEYREGAPSLTEQRRRLAETVKAGALVARDLMTAPAVTVDSAATLSQAARTMAHRKVKRLPVVDGEGRLLGVVSRGDLLKVFLRPDEEIAREVRELAIAPLLPQGEPGLRVRVEHGVVILTGWFRDPSLVPVAARMARAVEGVVDVEFELTGPELSPSTGRPSARTLH